MEDVSLKYSLSFERLYYLQRCVYLPIKVNTATPSARIPIRTPGIADTKYDKPNNRKNRIRHQVASEFGILIFILL